MIHPDGAFGVGWNGYKNGKLTDPNRHKYTLSSALTGAESFTWMYHMTKKDKYRKIAYHALKWIFSTMRGDGNIPHLGPVDGVSPEDQDKLKISTNFRLWKVNTYGTAAYVGEGVIAFARYNGKPAWTKWIGKAVRPNIEFLLRHQLKDGTWSKLGRKSWDRTRSPGIINYLIWYYENVDHDPRVAKAVRRFDAYVVDPKTGKQYGLLTDGAHSSGKDHSFDVVTSFTGRALAGILSPGIDAQW
jgi:hypothetical protein